MNTNTGDTYRLPMDVRGEPHQALTPRDFRNLTDERVEALSREDPQLVQDALAAFNAVSKGETVVPVSEQVAHAQRLGQRELERRNRRRKAAKQARKLAR